MLGKIVLSISAFIFTAYGILSLVSPELPAGFAGIEMTSGDAYAEIGAMYGGLQTGFGLFCLLALMRPTFYQPGLALLVIGIGVLAIARLYSSVTAPAEIGAYTIGAIVYEFATAILAAIAMRHSGSREQSE